jgi:hypothetical protein
MEATPARMGYAIGLHFVPALRIHISLCMLTLAFLVYTQIESNVLNSFIIFQRGCANESRPLETKHGSIIGALGFADTLRNISLIIDRE